MQEEASNEKLVGGSCCHSSFAVDRSSFRAEDEWVIRNFQLYHFLFRMQDKDRRVRVLWRTMLVSLVLLSIQSVFGWIVLFVDVKYANNVLEWSLVAFTFVAYIPPIFLANVDTLKRQAGLDSFADAVVLAGAIGFLLVIGEGYNFWGALVLFGGYENVYLVEPVEVFLLLNFEKLQSVSFLFQMKKFSFVMFIVACIVYRSAVFFEQITVVDGVLLEFEGVSPVTFRDAWLVLVDIILVRVIFKALERLQRSEDNTFESYMALGQINSTEVAA